MAQLSASAEPPLTPPPIPMRSSLRYGCTHQLKLSGITSDISTRTTKPPSPASQTLRERMDRELAGTRQGLGRGILKGKKTLKQKDLESRLFRQFSKATSHMRRTDSNAGEKDTFGEIGSKVSFPSELLEPLTPAQSTPQMKNCNMAITEYREDYKNVGCEHVRVAGRVATQQGRHDDATSTAQAVGLGLSSDSAPSSQCDSGTMDTRVTEWLAQESQGHLLPAADFVERDSGSPSPSRHVALSLFPPMSPTTGNREYTPPTSPLTHSTGPFSPLNNGRDAYGNYLPSNTHDYCAALPLPSPQSPQRVRKEQSFSGFENMSSSGRPRGASQSNFRPFWKAAATQVSNQGPAPIPLQQVDDHNDVAHDRPMVTHAGRSHSHSRASPSIRSQISTARSTPNLREPEKTLDEPSAIGTTRSKTWDSNERMETPELADIDEIVHQDFNNTATYNQRNASRAEKRCSKDSPLPSVRHKQSEDCLSNCSSEGTSSALSIISAGTADIKHIVSQGSGVSCQHNHEVQCAEAQQCHEETHEDTNPQQASQKQKHDQSTAVIHEGSAGAMRPRVPDRPIELKPRAAPEHHSPKISPNPSPYIPRYGPTPVSAQYPQKVKPGHESIGYPSVVSTSESTPSSGFKKSFQNALEKLSRKYKSSSKCHVRKGFKKREQTQIGMGADSNGWPRSRPMDARKTVSGSSRASKDDNNDESGKVESLLEEIRASESVLDDYSTTESLSTNRINTPAFSVDTMRSESANSTQTQQVSYSRTGPYARSPTPEISIPVVEGASFSRPINTSDRLNVTSDHAPGRLLTQFPQRPDRYGFLYIPHDEEELHSLDPSPGYLCHWPSDDALDSDFSTETKHTPFEYDDVLGQITHEQDVNGTSDEEDTMALLPPLPPDIEPDELTTHYHAITTSAAEESASPTMTNTSTSTTTTAATTPPSSLCSYQSHDSTSTTHERLLPPTPAPPVPPPKDNKTLLSPVTDDLQSRFSADSMRDTQREKGRRRHEDRARHLKFMRSFG